MSVFRIKNSPVYHYEFRLEGHRFRGTTETANRREAENVERRRREDAKRQLAAAKASPNVSLRFDDVVGRYWQEVGQHLAGEGADNCFRDLGRLVDYFGPDKLLTDIDNDDIARLVAWRRGQRVARYRKVRGRMVRDDDAPLVAPATVNRSTTGVLKKLCMRARNVWGVQFSRWPNWREHFLTEPIERVRELHEGEEERIIGAARNDYAPLIEFARMTGLRSNEVRTLEWSHVNWGTKQIIRLGKGRKRVVTPITDEVRELLFPLQGHHERYVFTYVCQRRRGKELIRGQRYPVTKEGLKTAWRRLRKTAGVDGEGGFRFHDFRHDLATKTLRETGNMKLVQKMLNHSNLTTTAKYAHVIDDEVAAALQMRAKGRVRKADLTTGVEGRPHTSTHSAVTDAAKLLVGNEKSA